MNNVIENTKQAVVKLLDTLKGHIFFELENEEERLAKLAIAIACSSYVVHPSDAGIIAILIDKIVMAERCKVATKTKNKEAFAE